MPATAASGTQAATIGTEHTLTTSAAAATHVLLVDLNNLALGDTVELRVKTKVLTGGTTNAVYTSTFSHNQANPVVQAIPVPSMFSFEASLKQTAGTGRSFPWSVLTLD